MKRSKRQTLWSKLIALGLVVVLTMAMGINVFAVQSTDTASFTVNGFDENQEVTVTAYQIITVNVNDDTEEPSYPMYTWNSNVATWLKANDSYSSYVDDSLGENAVADVFENMSAENKTKFLEELVAAIKKGTVSVTAAKEVTSANGSATFTDMAMGEYLLVAEGGLKLYQPTTVTIAPVYNADTQTWGVGTPSIGEGGTAANMKSQDLPFEKEATSGTTVQIGDTVTYKLTAVVPDYPEDAVAKTFKIGDTLSKGLDFQGVWTIKVSLNADMSSPINSVGNYTTTIDGAATETFVIEFTEDFINANAGETVYVTYDAKVNANAFTTDSLGNSAYSAYNDPYDSSSYVKVPAEEDVYTYGITLTKKDQNTTVTDGLAGAEFVLKKDNTELKFSERDGVYIYDANGTATLTTDKDGKLEIRGIDVGTYVLEEITAPDGYVLPTGSITITINDDADGAADGEIDTDSTVTKTGTIDVDDKSITFSNNVISFDVLNVNGDDASFTLPVTGGAGTVMFTIIGILLMGGAAAIIIISKKRSHTR